MSVISDIARPGHITPLNVQARLAPLPDALVCRAFYVAQKAYFNHKSLHWTAHTVFGKAVDHGWAAMHPGKSDSRSGEPRE